MSKEIWVLPEISGQNQEISKVSLGLLTEARLLAARVGGSLTALIFEAEGDDHRDLLQKYGVDRAIVFKDLLLKDADAWLYSESLKTLKSDKPFLFVMGHTVLGRELAGLLAVKWQSAIAPNCSKIEFEAPSRPRFFRAILSGQAHSEFAFENDGPYLATMDPRGLNILPVDSVRTLKIEKVKPGLKLDSPVKRLGCLPADFQTMDVAEARVVVGAGAGSLPPDIFALVQELASLVEAAVGATRPVIDEGRLQRQRLIGQTGKLINPDLYLALGISGASHHLGGIQDARTIVSVNRDPQAAIFQASDVGLVADLKEVLPDLIEKIKQAREDGKIV